MQMAWGSWNTWEADYSISGSCHILTSINHSTDYLQWNISLFCIILPERSWNLGWITAAGSCKQVASMTTRIPRGSQSSPLPSLPPLFLSNTRISLWKYSFPSFHLFLLNSTCCLLSQMSLKMSSIFYCGAVLEQHSGKVKQLIHGCDVSLLSCKDTQRNELAQHCDLWIHCMATKHYHMGKSEPSNTTFSSWQWNLYFFNTEETKTKTLAIPWSKVSRKTY